MTGKKKKKKDWRQSTAANVRKKRVGSLLPGGGWRRPNNETRG
jgi:hypothetical protein